MLYGSETWCLRENEIEMVILKRTERAMVRSMCGVKLVDRKNTEELIKMLGLKETLDKMAKANGVRWYGHVVRRDDESILKKAMMFEVNQWRGNVFWTGGAQNSKIVSTSGGRSPPDPPFFERTFL